MSATIVLDFNGAPALVWPNSPAVSAWGTPQQRAEVLARVAEKFSPFDVTVTDVDPGQYLPGQTLRVVIAGDSDGSWDNYGIPLGGTSVQGGWFPDAVDGPNATTCFVFAPSLANSASAIAETAAHELGHELGLVHQVVWAQSANGAFYQSEPYNTGTPLKAPVMGDSKFSIRGTWWYGPDQWSPVTMQDDVALLDQVLGKRTYGHAQTIADAEPLPASAQGVIVDSDQQHDVYRLDVTAPGTITLTCDVAPVGPMLQAKLLLEDSSGDVLATAADPGTLGQSITYALPDAGTYYAVVESFGGYGDLGQYTLSVTGLPEPSASLFVASLAAAAVLSARRRRH